MKIINCLGCSFCNSTTSQNENGYIQSNNTKRTTNRYLAVARLHISFVINFFYGLAGPEGMQGRPWPLKSFLVLAFAAITVVAMGQAEVQNPTFPFWKVKGNSGTSASTNFIGTTDSVDLVVKTNNTERMRVRASGNVGIGTTTPYKPLEITTSSNALNIAALLRNSSGNDAGGSAVGIGFHNETATGREPKAAIVHERMANYGRGSLHFLLNNTANTPGVTLADAAMTITMDKKVGIGTTTPQEILHIVGKLRMVDGSQANGYVMVSDANGTGTWTDPSTLGLSGNDWHLTGNSGTTVGTNFIGTTDAQPLQIRANNVQSGYISYTAPYNTGFGYNTLASVTGTDNTAFGYQTLTAVTTGTQNTAVGKNALQSTTTGMYNTAMGNEALADNNGTHNTAIGNWALTSNTTGFTNVAVGVICLPNNTTGKQNTAVGGYSLQANTTGDWNSAFGQGALYTNTTGTQNTGIGRESLFFNTTGSYNSANGYHGLYNNTTGNYNTAAGYNALVTNTTGSNNTAIGYNADVSTNNLTNATAIGYNAKVAASKALVLGGTGADAVNVGIGVTAPLDVLHIVGHLRMVDGSQANGYIMVSDANGTGTWTDPSTLGLSGNDWHLTGNSGTTAGTNFIGTTDAVDWVIKTNNTERARVKSTGNVGIATTAPGATLDVQGNGIVGASNTNTGTNALATGNNNSIAANYSFTSGAGNTITNGGTRGAVFNQSNSVTGNNSIAAGFQSNAGGNMSFAFGQADTATGQGSAAFGFSNLASGTYSFAAGSNNNATNGQSTAFGNDNTVSGSSSFAAGSNNTVSSNSAFVTGNANTLSGNNSLVTGNSNDVTATHTLVTGNDHTVAGNYSVVFNNNNSNTSAATTSITGGYQSQTQSNIALAIGWADTTSGVAAAAFGRGNHSSANYAFSAGYLNTASGAQSTAFGNNNTASATSAFVTGSGNTVSGSSALVGGNANTVTGTNTLVTGNGHTVAGSYSVVLNNTNSNTSSATTSITGGYQSQTQSNLGLAIGWGDTTSGVTAQAFGRGNYSRSYGEMSVGVFGTDYTPVSTGSFNSSDRVFNVGNGTATNARADAFTILKNGNVGVGTSTPATDLHVVGSIRMVDGTQANGYIMVSDANGTGTWTDPSTLGLSGSDWTLTGNSGTTAGTNFIGTTDAVDFVVRSSNTERMRVTSGGNIGMGHTNPLARLVVAETVDSSGVLRIHNPSNQSATRTWIGFSADNAWGTDDVNDRARIGMEVQTSGPGELFFTTGGYNNQQERVRINTNGYVGIGTRTPTSTMDIKGSFATTVKTAQTAGTNNPDVTGAVWIYSSGSGTITLPTASTCNGRRYVILNQTGSTVTTSTYIDITTASVTSLANNTSIEVISDGTNWRQIK